MGTFKAYFKKEILEAIRQYKYILLSVGILFFAISDPIMMKLLPMILKSQMQGDLSALFITNRRIVMQSYVKDLFQLGAMFVVFMVGSSLSEEINTKKLVFPYAKGGTPLGIVLAKIIHYSIATTVLTFCGFIINNYYVNLLFKNDTVPFKNVLISAVLISTYYIFNIVITTFFSAFLKRGIVAGFITIGIGYSSIVFNNFKAVGAYLPYRLISNASSFNNIDSTRVITFVLLCSILLIIFTVSRMSRVEVV